MAKIQKKPEEDHSNDWLNTYADMVTLLLTFFVMLYASSSIDEQKWQYIYQAFQSRGKYLNEYIDHPNHTIDEGSYVSSESPTQAGGDGTMPQSFDELYQYLSEYVEENELSDAVSVTQDAAHIYIKFDSDVFFEGNSAVLRQEGMDIINGISPGLTAVSDSIQLVTVSGHTAVGYSAVNDWDLSSGRASSVVKYMEYREVLDRSQFRTQGDGPNKPVADNSTEEGRAQNRRVELVILRNDFDETDPEVVKDILKHDYGLFSEQVDPDGMEEEPTKLPSDSAQGIINSIETLFPSDSSTGMTQNTATGPIVYDEFESFIKSDDAEGAGSAADSAADAAADAENSAAE